MLLPTNYITMFWRSNLAKLSSNGRYELIPFSRSLSAFKVLLVLKKESHNLGCNLNKMKQILQAINCGAFDIIIHLLSGIVYSTCDPADLQ